MVHFGFSSGGGGKQGLGGRGCVFLSVYWWLGTGYRGSGEGEGV